MKRKLLLAATIMLMMVGRADDLIVPAPAGNLITMTGSAIPLVPNRKTASPILCSQIQIQVQPGGNALIYVLNSAPQFTMGYGSAGTTTVDSLGPGTATQPGQQWKYPSGPVQGTFADMRYFGLYGTGTGPDTALVTCAVSQ